MISEEGLQNFIDLYKKKYFIELSRQEAFEMFSNLVRIIQISNSNNG